MTCPDCERTRLTLARLRAKHRRFAEETNRLLTDQAERITSLQATLEERGR